MKIKLASRLMQDPEVSVQEVLSAVGVSSATLYRYVVPDGTIRRSQDAIMPLYAPWLCRLR